MTVGRHPSSWAQADDSLADPTAVVVAGGTAVQPWLTATGVQPGALVHLDSIRESWSVHGTVDGLRIGAMVPVDHPALRPWFGDEGAAWFATPAVRRRATVLGNVVSRLGPRELGPVLVATGGRIDTRSDTHSVENLLREGLPAGMIATHLELSRPEKISYRRIAARSRMCRVQAGLCAAIGPGCGAALVLQTAGAAYRLDVEVPAGRDDFVEVVRQAAEAAPHADNVGDTLAALTVLAERVHGDLHRRQPV